MTRFIPDWALDIDLLINGTAIVAGVWLALAIFVYWRRQQTNLTPVDVPSANPDAQPDFLGVDKKKQSAALKRGDEYARSLEKRGQGSRVSSQSSPFHWIKKTAGYAALVLACLLIVVVAVGCAFPESYLGQLLNDYSAENRLADIIQSNPISLLIAVLVVLYRAITLMGVGSPVATD